MADNVIFIVTDDVNNWATLRDYYPGEVHTPNIDRLLAAGTNFTNAFCPQALCNPSRATILTGQDLLHTHVYGLPQPWHYQVPPSETIHAQFQNAGYNVVSIAKIYHQLDDAIRLQLFDQSLNTLQTLGQAANGVFAVYPGDETLLKDNDVADAAISFLKGQAPDGSGPKFMLNVGFFQPHLPWVVPAEYYDLYPIDQITLPFTIANDRSDIPSDALGPNALGFLSKGQWPQLVQAYLASLSFMDAQLGRVLDELDAHPGLAADTAIVWLADHGQYVGEKDLLAKNGLWEEALNSPLVIVDPQHGGGTTVDAVVSFADIAPTVLELAGLPVPASMDGRSLMPLLDNPQADWDNVAFSVELDTFSIRTDRYRYSLYSREGEELYDMIADRHEFTNLAGMASYAEIKEQLRKRLEAHLEEYHCIRPKPLDTVSTGSEANDTLMDMGRKMTLAGGAGNDSYLIRNLSTVVTEAPGAGTDTVVLLMTKYQMPANIEDLYALGGTANGGNMSYVIYGNELNNRIDLQCYSQTEVRGGAGNDRVIAQGTGTLVFFGGYGNDTLAGEGRSASFDGGPNEDSLAGTAGADTLSGAVGNDTLCGKLGADRLSGGLGNDIFLLSAAGESLASAPDIITDFEGAGATAGDLVDLRPIDANSTIALDQAFSSIGYCSGFTGFTASQQLMIVDSGADAIVYGNTDGNMATAEFAIVLQNVEHTSVTMADFLL